MEVVAVVAMEGVMEEIAMTEMGEVAKELAHKEHPTCPIPQE